MVSPLEGLPDNEKHRCETHLYSSEILPCPYPEHYQAGNVPEAWIQPVLTPTPPWTKEDEEQELTAMFSVRRFRRAVFMVGGKDWKMYAYGWQKIADGESAKKD